METPTMRPRTMKHFGNPVSSTDRYRKFLANKKNRDRVNEKLRIRRRNATSICMSPARWRRAVRALNVLYIRHGSFSGIVLMNNYYNRVFAPLNGPRKTGIKPCIRRNAWKKAVKHLELFYRVQARIRLNQENDGN